MSGAVVAASGRQRLSRTDVALGGEEEKRKQVEMSIKAGVGTKGALGESYNQT